MMSSTSTGWKEKEEKKEASGSEGDQVVMETMEEEDAIAMRRTKKTRTEGQDEGDIAWWWTPSLTINKEDDSSWIVSSRPDDFEDPSLPYKFLGRQIDGILAAVDGVNSVTRKKDYVKETNKSWSPKGYALVFPKPPFEAELFGFPDLAGGFVRLRFLEESVQRQYRRMQDAIAIFLNELEKHGSVDAVRMRKREFDFSGRDEILADFSEYDDDWEKKGDMDRWSDPFLKRRFSRVRLTGPFKWDSDDKKKHPSKVIVWDLDNLKQRELLVRHAFKFPEDLSEIPCQIQYCRIQGLEFWSDHKLLCDIMARTPPLEDIVSVVSVKRDKEWNCAVVDLRVRVMERYLKNLPDGSPANNEFRLTDLVQYYLTGFTRVPIPNHPFLGAGTRIIDDAYVGSVFADGKVAIVINSDLHRRVTTIEETPRMLMTSQMYNPTSMSDFQYAYYKKHERRFLSRYSDHPALYRVEVLEEYNDGYSEWIRVVYLDFGNELTVPVKDLIPMAFVDPILSKIQPQVYYGRLKGIQKIKDEEKYMELFSIACSQAVMGFTEKDGTHKFDVYAETSEVNSETGETTSVWVYVNQYIVDKGIAIPEEENHEIVPWRNIPSPSVSSPFRMSGDSKLIKMKSRLFTRKEMMVDRQFYLSSWMVDPPQGDDEFSNIDIRYRGKRQFRKPRSGDKNDLLRKALNAKKGLVKRYVLC